MKKCPHCGKEYTGEIALCTLDNQPLIECDAEGNAIGNINPSKTYELIAVIHQQSGWERSFQIGGWLNLIGAAVSVFLIVLDVIPSSVGVGMAIGCVLGCSQCFFFSFLIGVFTDVRWFVAKLAVKFEAVALDKIRLESINGDDEPKKTPSTT